MRDSDLITDPCVSKNRRVARHQKGNNQCDILGFLFGGRKSSRAAREANRLAAEQLEFQREESAKEERALGRETKYREGDTAVSRKRAQKRLNIKSGTSWLAPEKKQKIIKV